MKPLEPKTPAEKRIFIWAAVTGLAVLAADVLTKLWVLKSFRLYESREIIPGILAFTSVRNPGAAWSIFSGHAFWLLLFGVAAGVAIICFARYLAEGWHERFFAIALVVAGIIGNCIDRLRFNAVVDFIHVHWHDVWHYPIFNVADMAICCGVGVFLISNFCRKNKTESGDDVSGECERNKRG